MEKLDAEAKAQAKALADDRRKLIEAKEAANRETRDQRAAADQQVEAMQIELALVKRSYAKLSESLPGRAPHKAAPVTIGAPQASPKAWAPSLAPATIPGEPREPPPGTGPSALSTEGLGRALSPGRAS